MRREQRSNEAAPDFKSQVSFVEFETPETEEEYPRAWADAMMNHLHEHQRVEAPRIMAEHRLEVDGGLRHRKPWLLSSDSSDCEYWAYHENWWWQFTNNGF